MHYVLYLGLDPSRFSQMEKIIHYPVIRIEPRQGPEVQKAFSRMQEYTHLVCHQKPKRRSDLFFPLARCRASRAQ